MCKQKRIEHFENKNISEQQNIDIIIFIALIREIRRLIENRREEIRREKDRQTKIDKKRKKLIKKVVVQNTKKRKLTGEKCGKKMISLHDIIMARMFRIINASYQCALNFRRHIKISSQTIIIIIVKRHSDMMKKLN